LSANYRPTCWAIRADFSNMDRCAAANATFRLAANAFEALSNIPFAAPAPNDPYLPPRPIEATRPDLGRPGWSD
jgi:hypothetical protein